MNSHKNARLTFEGRKLLIERIAVMGLIPAAKAAGFCVFALVEAAGDGCVVLAADLNLPAVAATADGCHET